MKYILLSLLSLILLGCSSQEEVNKENKGSFAAPETVGTLPDGRTIQVVQYRRTSTSSTHFIYFVGSDITINRAEGKQHLVNVVIDGVEYQPVTKPEK